MNRIISATCSRMLMPSSFLKLFFAITLLMFNIGAKAQIVTWTDAGIATDWYTPANWTPPTSAGGWLTTNTAVFNNTGTATTAGINMAAGSLSIAAVNLATRTRDLTIGNSSNTNGTLQLNGANVGGFNNVILHLFGAMVPAYFLTIQNSLAPATGTTDIMLGNAVDNVILTSGTAPRINISAPITGAGKNLSIRGNGSTGGVITLTGNNTYNGLTTIASRTRRLILARPGGGTLPATNDVSIFDGTLVVNTDQTLRNIGLLGFGAGVEIANGATLTITGTFTQNTGFVTAIGTGKLVYTTGATLLYNSSSNTVGGNEFPALYGPTNVTLTGLATLSTSRAISGTLTLNGAMVMGANDFTAGAVSGSGRMVTSGTGKLNITNVGAAPVIFPVALAIGGSYNPVTITNGQGLTYGVRVASGINPPGVLIPNNAVNRTWSITPVGPLSASPVNMAFYYTAGDGNAGFNYATPVDLGRFTSSWVVVQSGIPQIIPLPTLVAFMTPGVANTFVIGNVGAIH